jgi:hypothetical protein
MRGVRHLHVGIGAGEVMFQGTPFRDAGLQAVVSGRANGGGQPLTQRCLTNPSVHRRAAEAVG